MSAQWYRVGDNDAPGVGERVEARSIGSSRSWTGTIARIERYESGGVFMVTLGFEGRASRMSAGEVRAPDDEQDTPF